MSSKIYEMGAILFNGSHTYKPLNDTMGLLMDRSFRYSSLRMKGPVCHIRDRNCFLAPRCLTGRRISIDTRYFSGILLGLRPAETTYLISVQLGLLSICWSEPEVLIGFRQRQRRVRRRFPAQGPAGRGGCLRCFRCIR